MSHHSQSIIHKHSLLLSLPQAINNALLTNTIRVEIDGRFGCGFADLYKVESREDHVNVGLHSSWIFANFHQMERTITNVILPCPLIYNNLQDLPKLSSVGCHKSAKSRTYVAQVVMSVKNRTITTAC